MVEACELLQTSHHVLSLVVSGLKAIRPVTILTGIITTRFFDISTASSYPSTHSLMLCTESLSPEVPLPQPRRHTLANFFEALNHGNHIVSHHDLLIFEAVHVDAQLLQASLQPIIRSILIGHAEQELMILLELGQLSFV